MKIKEYTIIDFLEKVQEKLMDGYELDLKTLISYRGRYEIDLTKLEVEASGTDIGTDTECDPDEDPIFTVAKLRSKKEVIAYAKETLDLDLNPKDGFVSLKNDVIAVLETDNESNS